MPPTSPADATQVLQSQHAELELGVRRWLQRLPRGHQLGQAADILQSISGALWIELALSANPGGTATSCLRRVLYREYEKLWRHAPCSLDSQSELWVPEHHQDAALALQAWSGKGHPSGPWIKYKGAGIDLLNPKLQDA